MHSPYTSHLFCILHVRRICIINVDSTDPCSVCHISIAHILGLSWNKQMVVLVVCNVFNATFGDEDGSDLEWFTSFHWVQ